MFLRNVAVNLQGSMKSDGRKPNSEHSWSYQVPYVSIYEILDYVVSND